MLGQEERPKERRKEQAQSPFYHAFTVSQS